jgi:toxin secretion/phage lysis holin
MKKISESLAAIGGAIASFFCGLPPIMWVLIAVMSIDYITGILCGLMGKSPKTPTGGLSSNEAFKGLLKKALILLVVLLAALLDKAVSMGTGVSFEAVAGATCLWFIASEGFSILENVASMGVPVPKILLQALEIMRSKGNVPEKTEEEKEPEEEPEDLTTTGD